MPATVINGSPNIASLDSQVVGNLCNGIFYIDLTPSIFIGSGASNVLGANVQITNPSGVIVKPYGTNYEIAPGLSGGMDAVISFPVPTIASNYQYGQYTVTVQLYDADGTVYTNVKTFSICAPDAKNPTRKYGSLSATLKGVCKDGQMFVIVDNVPTYKGKISDTQVNDFTLEYPTASQLDPLETTQPNFVVVLFEGEYKLTGTICANYDIGDNVAVKINYKVKKIKNQKCIIDLCCIQDQLTALNAKRNSDCTDAEKAVTANTILEVLMLLRTAELAADCGEDPSEYISELEVILGCTCTCNCNEGTPIIGTSVGSNNISITGCNFTSATVGQSTIYNIDNYSYVVSIANGGAMLVAADATLAGCVKTQVLTFNVAAIYTQIVQYALINPCDWAAVVKRCMKTLNPSCLGLTVAEYEAMTFNQFMQAIIDMFCTGGICKAYLINVQVEQSNEVLKFTWQETGITASTPSVVEIYVDDVLIATVLGGVLNYTSVDSILTGVHTYKLIPKCGNGTSGTVSQGTITLSRPIFVAKPSVYSPYLQGLCPYDLTTNVEALPLGLSAEWHTVNNTNAATLVPDPSNALQGVYWVFATDTEGAYSESVQVQLVCDESGSCSAPQNLTVVPAFNSNLIQFQSAAYPPPLNSYTVKRRLESASDVAGNYTTIGTPVWNPSASRWVINDPTAVSDVLYVYRAISNCVSTAPYIDVEYANIICPTLALTGRVTDVDYIVAPMDGEVTQMKVIIYSDAGGVTPVHTDTFNSPFASILSGTFAYLDPETTYYVGVKGFIGLKAFKVCGLQVVETLPDTATLTLDYIAGSWTLALTSPLPVALYVGNSTNQVLGSNASNCVGTVETDLLNEIEIPAGDIAASDETNGLTYLSTYYHINDAIEFGGGIGTISSGGTFTVGGVLVTLSVQHLLCSYYPA